MPFVRGTGIFGITPFRYLTIGLCFFVFFARCREYAVVLSDHFHDFAISCQIVVSCDPCLLACMVCYCRGDVPGSPFKLIKGRADVPCTYDEMMVSMTCPTTENFNRSMRTVDEMFVCGRSLHTIAGRGAQQDEFGNVLSTAVLPYASLRWSSFATPWPLWHRDFVFVQYVDVLEVDGERVAVCLSFSVDRPDAPALTDSHKLVRAFILETGYVARERRGKTGELDLTYAVRVDAAGVIPGECFRPFALPLLMWHHLY